MHHANLLIGRKDWAFSHIAPSDTVPGTDTIVLEYEKMGIEQVRSLIHDASLRPVERSYRSFIVVAGTILREAQNALLKLFEEPNEHTLFYVVLPREDILLPTLRSRFHLLAVEEAQSESGIFDAFLKASPAERLSLIAKNVSDERTDWIYAIVQGFSEYAHTTRNPQTMRDALTLESYIHTNGSSKKMLLEHITLSL